MDCPFCPRIERKTEWYSYDPADNVVACEDLNPKGYKYRILVVGSGPFWHRPWKDYSDKEAAVLMKVAQATARHHIKIGKAKKLVDIDTVHFSHPEHGHVQACMS